MCKKHHHEQADCSQELQKSPYTLLLGESYDRDEKDCTHWNADCEQGDLHSFTHLRRVVDEFAAPEMKRLVSWPPSCFGNIDLSVLVLGWPNGSLV